jgi:uncharacterized protein involved in propanediol utilization
MPELLHLASEAGALGVQVAHSGTVAGFLFAPGAAADAGIERAREGLDRLGVPASWEFAVDPAPHPEDPS